MRTRRDPKVERLASLPILRGFTDRELHRLAPLFDELDFEAGDVLMREGRCGGETFIVASGQVTVSRTGQPAIVLGPGEIVGELAVLAHGPRSATVTCDTRVRAFVLSPEAFSTLLEEPMIGGNVARTLARRFGPRHVGATR